MSWVIDNAPRDISAGDYLTMLMIGNHVSKNGEAAFPSVILLAEETRLSKTQVLNCLRRLEEKNLISTERGIGRGHRSKYRLPGFDCWLQKVKGIDYLPSAEKVNAVDHSKNGNGQIYNDKRSNSDGLNGQISETPPTPPYKAEPLREPLEEPLPFSSPQFLEAWNDYAQARKEKRAKVTPTIRKVLCKRMAQWGEQRSIVALIHSIAYTGLFEPKNGNGATQQTSDRPTWMASGK